jgi:hypothetical protein
LSSLTFLWPSTHISGTGVHIYFGLEPSWNICPKKGTRQIRVILYAKGALRGATASADELPIEDILTVKHDVIPLDGADVFQQGSIDSIGNRVALAQDPGDLPRLPVDDARQDQVQTATARGR